MKMKLVIVLFITTSLLAGCGDKKQDTTVPPLPDEKMNPVSTQDSYSIPPPPKK
jgi:uncharacterized lipoprotein YajG